MHILQAELRNPKEAAMVTTLITDSVYTPARAHLRWGYGGVCGLCGAECGDRTHYVQRCTQTPRMHDKGDTPDCLTYIGNIPAGSMQSPGKPGDASR